MRGGLCRACRSLSCTPAVCSRSPRENRHRRRQRYYHSERGPSEVAQDRQETSSPVKESAID